jgi:hypothetical protein
MGLREGAPGVRERVISVHYSVRLPWEHVFVNTREQGDWGELSAASWFTGKGAMVAWPLGHSPNWDLLIEWHECLYRVQVKTSTQLRRNRWHVFICTRGGNQSWNGLSKRFSPSRCDFLFVYVADGRRWVIPSRSVEGGSGIAVGGPKYAEWEVERGDPLPGWSLRDSAA